MRLIDADALIPNEECDKKRCIDCELNYIVGCDDVENLVKHAETIEPEPQWIPVTERLPEERDVYMVTGKNGNVNLFLYTNTEESDEYWKLHILAWMPLPEPWKGEEP